VEMKQFEENDITLHIISANQYYFGDFFHAQ
jgi:hypothetical protein